MSSGHRKHHSPEGKTSDIERGGWLIHPPRQGEAEMIKRIAAPMLLLAALVPALLPSTALAVALGVTPGNMEFNTQPGGTDTQVLHVYNQSDNDAIFRVYIEGEYEDWFAITPGEFTLPPHQSQDVEIALETPRTAQGTHDPIICVVSIPAGSDLNIGAGIRVSAHVQITGPPVTVI